VLHRCFPDRDLATPRPNPISGIGQHSVQCGPKSNCRGSGEEIANGSGEVPSLLSIKHFRYDLFYADCINIAEEPKKRAILAPLAPSGPQPSGISLSVLPGDVVQNGPERSRARRCWGRRSGPLTARTVLRGWKERERRGEELAKDGAKKWPLRSAPLTAGPGAIWR
jgi:hypothetical protein